MTLRKPDWLKIKLQGAGQISQTERMLRQLSLHTVCEEANCPNRVECFGKKTATFMILGKVCTRRCTFCCVSKGAVQAVDPEEAVRVAAAVKALGLKHVVVTSVTRDDLPDGGAAHFARVIQCIRELNDEVVIEVLIPDLGGDHRALATVVKASPQILNHNVETVPRLYPEVRPAADYHRSLRILAETKKLDPAIHTKSGIMVGLGEDPAEVAAVMADLRAAGCDFLTVGQYLAPSREHHPVMEYVQPQDFLKYRQQAERMGFRHVASGPFVRSSYHAAEISADLGLS